MIKSLTAEQNADIERNHILVEDSIYSRFRHPCLLYNDEVYYCREGVQQMRIAVHRTTLVSVRDHMKKNLVNIVPSSYVTYIPDLKLKKEYEGLYND